MIFIYIYDIIYLFFSCLDHDESFIILYSAQPFSTKGESMSSSNGTQRAIRTAGTINEFAISTAYQFLDQAEDVFKTSKSAKYSAVIHHTAQCRADEVIAATKIIAEKDTQYWGVIVEKTERHSTGVEIFFRAA